MGFQTEESPLLTKETTTVDVEAQATAEQQEWDGGLINCCGNSTIWGDAIGWKSCALVTFFPSCLFGHNVKHALRFSMGAHIALYLVLFFVGRYIYSLTLVNTYVECEPLHLHKATNATAALRGPVPFQGVQLLRNYWQVWTQGEADVLFNPAQPNGVAVAHKVTINELTPECHDAVTWLAVVDLLSLIMCWCGLFYAAYCRKAIREKFNIPGNYLTDFCSWFLFPCCALTQETRTILKNRVRNGIWQGPLSTPLPLANVPPFPQTMGKPV